MENCAIVLRAKGLGPVPSFAVALQNAARVCVAGAAALVRAGLRAAPYVSLAFGALGLVASALWLWLEAGWTAPQDLSPEDAFKHGTIGLEIAPLKYLLVMDVVSKKAMTNGTGRPWPAAFGFIAAGRKGGKACLSDAAQHLPLGFTTSHLLPGSAAGTPVPFVGLTCALCHSTALRTPDGHKTGVVYGVGNNKLDIFAWQDAFSNAVLDRNLTVDKIMDAYDAQGCNDGGALSHWPLTYVERFFLQNWLTAIRQVLRTNTVEHDAPFFAAALEDHLNLPSGPMRTRPFQGITRFSLNVPSAENRAISKIGAVFEQDPALKPHAQFDGSISDPILRSMVAVYASGTTVEALSKPIVMQNVRAAAAYTLHLGDDYGAYSYAGRFPQHPIDGAAAARGYDLYKTQCQQCHGSRPPGGGRWSLAGAPYVNRIAPLGPAAGAVPTDIARLEFRYADMVPDAIYLRFPGTPAAGGAATLADQRALVASLAGRAAGMGNGAIADIWSAMADNLERARLVYPRGHPMAYRHDLLQRTPGYLNAPLPFAYLRAPYLHNASVPTLAELINLKPRPARFCRGDNDYDPDDVGIVASEQPAGVPCPADRPFLFDAAQIGNGNRGHDFPWAWNDAGRDPAKLRDLLEYLKTL